ncbi:MAG TPA: hypothetical protein VFR37_05470 [Longimicrobium sp.]|nr:hypothetical protein [Longimicrobium sp.]
MLRTTVPLGDQLIEIEEEDLRSLLKEMTHIRELHEAAEGHACTPFHRHAGGFDFYGLRRLSDDHEVQFGQHKAGNGVEAGTLFAKRRTSRSYVGFQPPRFAAPPEDAGDEGPEPPAPARDQPQPTRQHAAMIYFVRRLFPTMRRLAWQMRIDGDQKVIHRYLSTQEGWDRLVRDAAFALQVLARIRELEPTEPFDVEREHDLALADRQRGNSGRRGRARRQ